MIWHCQAYIDLTVLIIFNVARRKTTFKTQNLKHKFYFVVIENNSLYLFPYGRIYNIFKQYVVLLYL